MSSSGATSLTDRTWILIMSKRSFNRSTDNCAWTTKPSLGKMEFKSYCSKHPYQPQGIKFGGMHMSISSLCQPYMDSQQHKWILTAVCSTHPGAEWLQYPLSDHNCHTYRLNHFILRKFYDVSSMGFALGEKWVLLTLCWEHMVLVIFKVCKHTSWGEKKKKKEKIYYIVFESSIAV